MNRVIKFRAWDAINKEMKYPRKKDVFATGPSSGEFVDNWDNVMQFTGLTDKNGTEIYEGDVVTAKISGNTGTGDRERKGEVIFHKGCFMIFANNEPVSILFLLYDIEVIGNIYENPELLKQ